MDDIVILAGKKEDYVDAVDESAKSEGWAMSYGDYDAYLMWLGSDKLHHAVARTKAGEFVGCCMCLNMDDMAFVALYYVRPQYRGRGIGHRLFKTVLPPALTEEKNAGLHAAPRMSQIYDNVLGFNKYTTWRSDVILLQDIDLAKLKEVLRGRQYSVKDVSEVPIDEVVAYDQTMYKSKREAFVRNFIARRKDGVCKVVIDQQGAIVGYGCAHILTNGSPTLCPIYCDMDDAFLALINEILSCYSEELKKTNCVDLRPPSIKTARISTMLQDISKVVKKADNLPQFTKFIPEHDVNKLYSLADLNTWI